MNTWRTAKYQYDCLPELGPWINYGLIVVANMWFMVAFLVQLASRKESEFGIWPSFIHHLSF